MQMKIKNTKKVLVDVSKTISPYNGSGQFCIRLGNSLCSIEDDNLMPVLLAPKEKAHLFPNHHDFRWRRELQRRNVPKLLKKIFSQQGDHYDIWHVTSQDSDFWPLDTATPVILTIHDLNFLRESKTPGKISKRLRLLQSKVDRASIIATVSKFSAKDIRKHLDLKGKPLQVIYNGGIEYKDHKDHTVVEQCKPEFAPDNKFLFSIGEITPKKNFAVLLPMLKGLPEYHLVLSGKNDTSYCNEIKDCAQKLGLQNRVHLSGVVSDQELLWLYQNCEGLLFPSLTEGFGLPVIEAMHFGKPVFLSESTSLPEIAAELGNYWKNYDPEHMQEVVREGIKQAAENTAFKNKLKDRAQQFSWQKAAEEYWTLYNTLISHSITKVSLIISTYNWVGALRVVLISALNQSRMPDEIIVADDGSDENTQQLIRELQNQHPEVEIKHIWQEDNGFRKCKILNKSIAAATGNYIINTDGDMVLHRHFVQDHVLYARRGSFIQGSRVILGEQISHTILQRDKFEDLFFFSPNISNRKNTLRISAFARAISRKEVSHTDSIRGCNQGFWKDDIIAVNGYDEAYEGWGREDSDFCVRLMNNGVKRRNLKFSSIAYHLHHEQSDRNRLAQNDQILEAAIALKLTSCELGINQYFEA